MNASLPNLLADLETDAGADTAAAFTRLVADYLADTRTGDGRVSTAHTPADLAARFAEPLPREGRPLEASPQAAHNTGSRIATAMPAREPTR